jgi:penicillin-binding protein 1A
MVPVTTAFALSLNTCSVQTYFHIGADPIIDFASRLLKLSNRNRLHPDPALALGSSEVTPFEMANAVSIIANEGRDVIPFPIRYVVDQSGNIVYNQEERIIRAIETKTKNKQIQVIEPSLAYLMRKLMQTVVDSGTATRGVRDQMGFRGDLAAKTGTTSSWSDAWIVGFNPEYAMATWIGFDKSSVTLGPGQAGGHIASPIMGAFYKRYYSETGSRIPSFKDRTGTDETPPGVIKGDCGGPALAAGIVNGQLKKPHGTGACAGADGRIYDQRELLMQQLGVTPEELGIGKGRVQFKTEH